MDTSSSFKADSLALSLWQDIKNHNNIIPIERVMDELCIDSMKDITDEIDPSQNAVIKGAAVARKIAENFPIYIDKRELFASGTTISTSMYEKSVQGRDPALFNINQQIYNNCLGNSSHSAVNYKKLIAIGIEGVLEEVSEKLASENDIQNKSFYESMISCLNSILIFATRLKEQAKVTLNTLENSENISMLSQMVSALENVPFKPATSFYEGIQSILVYHVFLKLTERVNNSLGRIDFILNDLYKHDLESGLITNQEAYNYIHMLFINSSCITQFADSITLGGQDERGNVFYNNLTYLCFDAINELKNQNPQVGFRYMEGHPDSLLMRAFKPILNGVANPCIFGDNTAVSALVRAGFELGDARNYVNCQCVELSPQGMSNIISGAFYWDLSTPLKILLGIQKDDDYCPKNYSTFDELYKEYFSLLKLKLKELAETIIHWQEQDQHITYIPLISSALIEGTIDKALPAICGGAKYNFTFPTFIAAATTVDSLAAIKTCIFDKNLMTLEELSTTCKNNYKNEDDLRKLLLNKSPKFGNNDEITNTLMNTLTSFIYNELTQYKNLYGETIGPCYFGFVIHGADENTFYATPDGRQSGDALSCTFGSDMGREKSGPTKLLNSALSFDHTLALGGLATNFTINKTNFKTDEDLTKLMYLVKSYLKQGGMQLQFNLISKEELLDAQIYPEKHKNLLVRIAGFTGKFVEQNKSIQNQIIDRIKE